MLESIIIKKKKKAHAKNMSPTLKENNLVHKLIWGWVYLCDFHLIS
jgi:hypothetical protein